MIKRSLIYSIIITILTIIIAFIMNIKSLNKMVLSNYFFIISNIILLIAAISRIISWSIHKKSALKRYKDEVGRENDIIDAKYKLKIISNSFFIIGTIQIIIALIFAIV